MQARPTRKPKSRYHHGSLREALVRATLGQVERAGTSAVSSSAIARKVGVSPQALYNHFPDKGALLAAAAARSIGGLTEALQTAREAHRDPVRRLQAVGVAYVVYAVAHDAHFRLWRAPELERRATWPELVEAYASALAVLEGCIAEGLAAKVLTRDDPASLARTAWAVVHGLASLLVDGQLTLHAGQGTQVEALARRAVEHLFVGFGAK